ncbi:uncharacterized protein DS421_12g367680 [Arachis hypogaea]|nr:uncharacterized protein DS421_12g367680 [Arachis hypogaea]
MRQWRGGRGKAEVVDSKREKKNSESGDNAKNESGSNHDKRQQRGNGIEAKNKEKRERGRREGREATVVWLEKGRRKEGAEVLTEDVPTKLVPFKCSSKRSRVAEVHNLSKKEKKE